jgi:hypothetical protein
MTPIPAYLVRVTPEMFAIVKDDNDYSGYLNSTYGDIIIDLSHVEDDDRREDFAKSIGIKIEELPSHGLIIVYQ